VREPRGPVLIRGRKAADRWEKAKSYKTHMNERGESYSGVVPAKQPNESLGGPQEAVEGRPLTKENMEEPNSRRTQSRESETSGLDRVRQAAKEDGKLQFTALLHHVNVDLFRSSYQSLKKRVAAGVDGVTWD
jgi:RNA-directed DNA polymerase